MTRVSRTCSRRAQQPENPAFIATASPPLFEHINRAWRDFTGAPARDRVDQLFALFRLQHHEGFITRATKLQVDQYLANGALQLKLRNDGCGFDQAGERENIALQRGLGLLVMEGRMALVGGMLGIARRRRHLGELVLSSPPSHASVAPDRI